MCIRDRPFISNTFSIPLDDSIDADKAYKVSVGNAIIPSFFRIFTEFLIKFFNIDQRSHNNF